LTCPDDWQTDWGSAELANWRLPKVKTTMAFGGGPTNVAAASMSEAKQRLFLHVLLLAIKKRFWEGR